MQVSYQNGLGETVIAPLFKLFTDHKGQEWVVTWDFRSDEPRCIRVNQIAIIPSAE